MDSMKGVLSLAPTCVQILVEQYGAVLERVDVFGQRQVGLWL